VLDGCEKKKKKTPLGVKGQAGNRPACPYGQIGMGREAICLLFFPLLLRLAADGCIQQSGGRLAHLKDIIHAHKLVGVGWCAAG
jgi:hypothetical protein